LALPSDETTDVLVSYENKRVHFTRTQPMLTWCTNNGCEDGDFLMSKEVYESLADQEYLNAFHAISKAT